MHDTLRFLLQGLLGKFDRVSGITSLRYFPGLYRRKYQFRLVASPLASFTRALKLSGNFMLFILCDANKVLNFLIPRRNGLQCKCGIINIIDPSFTFFTNDAILWAHAIVSSMTMWVAVPRHTHYAWFPSYLVVMYNSNRSAT
ncbi:unnamed protein product [Rhizophagus irregularis]|nr:unnamed protein product [Rhizophagus irregularis]